MDDKAMAEHRFVNAFHQTVVILAHERIHRRRAGYKVCRRDVTNRKDLPHQGSSLVFILDAVFYKGHNFVLLFQIRDQPPIPNPQFDK